MDLSEALPRIAASLYYSVGPVLRPNGHHGRVTRAVRAREGLEWRSPEQVRARQLEKLNSLLAHAVRSVPYYRRLAHEGRLPARLDDPADLGQAPVLTKDVIRAEGDNLLSETYPRDMLRRLATGGSTGHPLSFYSDEEALICKNAAESWSNAMAGLRRGGSLALLWGAGNFEPLSRSQSLRERLQLLLSNRMFIDCFHMAEGDLEIAHRRLTRFRPEGLLGYTSALVHLARYLQSKGLRPGYPAKAVISAAETLDEVSREILRETFGAPVFNRYGSREMGLIAVECELHQGLHVDCENVFVELVEGPPGTGLQRILVTKLTQYGMPFIRYEMGDLAAGDISRCECGRGYPVLNRVVGRVTEMIRMPDGGCLPGELFPHLLKDCGISEYQVVQAEDYSVELVLVKAPGQTVGQDELMRRVISQYLGDTVEIKYTYVATVSRSATGKLLPVISRAPR